MRQVPGARSLNTQPLIMPPPSPTHRQSQAGGRGKHAICSGACKEPSRSLLEFAGGLLRVLLRICELIAS